MLSAWASFGVLLAAALILLATLTPLDGEGSCGSLLGLTDKLWHALLFTLLGVPVALRYATSRAAARSPLRVLLMVVLAIWLFAALDELAQRWVEGRDADLGDWIADMGGALTGLLLGSLVLRFVLARSS